MRLLLDWVSMFETSSTHDHVAVIYSICILIVVFFDFFICLIFVLFKIFYIKIIYFVIICFITKKIEI
jgi:hypothetical protein